MTSVRAIAPLRPPLSVAALRHRKGPVLRDSRLRVGVRHVDLVHCEMRENIFDIR